MYNERISLVWDKHSVLFVINNSSSIFAPI